MAVATDPGQRRPLLSDLRSHVTCVICAGYFIDATTIVECLHTFCRSCILRHLSASSYCPVCDVMIHRTKGASSLRSDRTLQTMVYKLVPGLFQKEMRQRREFYDLKPYADPELPGWAKGDVSSFVPHVFTASEHIDVRLAPYDDDRPASSRDEVARGGTATRRHVTGSRSGGDGPRRPSRTAPGVRGGRPPVRYLRCTAGTPLTVLQKFVRAKFQLPPTVQVRLIYGHHVLPDDITLMDLEYLYRPPQACPVSLAFGFVRKRPAACPSPAHEDEPIREPIEEPASKRRRTQRDMKKPVVVLERMFDPDDEEPTSPKIVEDIIASLDAEEASSDASVCSRVAEVPERAADSPAGANAGSLSDLPADLPADVGLEHSELCAPVRETDTGGIVTRGSNGEICHISNGGHHNSVGSCHTNGENCHASDDHAHTKVGNRHGGGEGCYAGSESPGMSGDDGGVVGESDRIAETHDTGSGDCDASDYSGSAISENGEIDSGSDDIRRDKCSAGVDSGDTNDGIRAASTAGDHTSSEDRDTSLDIIAGEATAEVGVTSAPSSQASTVSGEISQLTWGAETENGLTASYVGTTKHVASPDASVLNAGPVVDSVDSGQNSFVVACDASVSASSEVTSGDATVDEDGASPAASGGDEEATGSEADQVGCGEVSDDAAARRPTPAGCAPNSAAKTASPISRRCSPPPAVTAPTSDQGCGTTSQPGVPCGQVNGDVVEDQTLSTVSVSCSTEDVELATPSSATTVDCSVQTVASSKIISKSKDRSGSKGILNKTLSITTEQALHAYSGSTGTVLGGIPIQTGKNRAISDGRKAPVMKIPQPLGRGALKLSRSETARRLGRPTSDEVSSTLKTATSTPAKHSTGVLKIPSTSISQGKIQTIKSFRASIAPTKGRPSVHTILEHIPDSSSMTHSKKSSSNEIFKRTGAPCYSQVNSRSKRLPDVCVSSPLDLSTCSGSSAAADSTSMLPKTSLPIRQPQPRKNKAVKPPTTQSIHSIVNNLTRSQQISFTPISSTSSKNTIPKHRKRTPSPKPDEHYASSHATMPMPYPFPPYSLGHHDIYSSPLHVNTGLANHIGYDMAMRNLLTLSHMAMAQGGMIRSPMFPMQPHMFPARHRSHDLHRIPDPSLLRQQSEVRLGTSSKKASPVAGSTAPQMTSPTELTSASGHRAEDLKVSASIQHMEDLMMKTLGKRPSGGHSVAITPTPPRQRGPTALTAGRVQRSDVLFEE